MKTPLREVVALISDSGQQDAEKRGKMPEQIWKFLTAPPSHHPLTPSPPSRLSLTLASLLFPRHINLTGAQPRHLFLLLPGRLFPQPCSGMAPITPFAFLLNCHLWEASPNCATMAPHPLPSLPFWFHLPYFVSLHSTYLHLQIYYLLVGCLPLLPKCKLPEGKDFLAHWSIPHAYTMPCVEWECSTRLLGGWTDGGWTEIRKQEQTRTLNLAYKYEGSQGESCVQRLVRHAQTHASANPEGKMYHELRAFPTHDLAYGNWAHSNNERRRKSLSQG